MESINTLIEDYKRRLKTITDEHPVGYDAVKTNRLRTKAGCYRTFIAELEKLISLPPSEEKKPQTEKVNNLRQMYHGNTGEEKKEEPEVTQELRNEFAREASRNASHT